jgi:CHAT domain-containing protein
LIGRWRSEVAAAATQDALEVRSATHLLRATGQRLRTAVWDPVATHLTGARMIFVVPDGALNLVPLAALPGHTSEFLLDDGPVVHYLSAERDLVASSPRPSANRLLALGGADFDGQTSAPQESVRSTGESPVESTQSRGAMSKCVGFDGIRFPALADTLAEVQDVARLWSGSTPSAVESVRVLAGNDASERTLKREAHHYQVLHLATHGFFLGGLCQPGAAGMRSVGGLVASSPVGTTVVNGKDENPLLLSGLALAGANRRATVGPEEDDGILTAEEVASLDLTDTEWAVLSACDTGVGEIKAGEGVFGLRRAFRIAGARTVIMSLWPVDDRATRVWMRALYDGRLKKRLNTADAVREASLAVLRDRRATGQSTHPFYWAAFVASGDWH